MAGAANEASSRGAHRAAALAMALGIALTACSPSLVPPRQGIEVRDVEMPVRQLTFPSGLRVLLERDARSPLVGLFLVVGAGSTADPPGKEGLAHYVEHLAFRSRPFGKASVWHLLETSGASVWNASTSRDETLFWEIGAAGSLRDLLRLQGARMLNPVARVPAETAAVELEVVRNELRQRNETGAAGEILGAMQAALFPKSHPYARPTLGTHASLSSLAAEDVARFVEANYRPENMTLLVLGDIDANQAAELVEKTLPPELLAARARPRPAPTLPARAPVPPDPPPAAGIVRLEASVATPELWIGWTLPRAFDADAYVLDFVQHDAQLAMGRAEREDRDIAAVDVALVPGKDASMLLCRVLLTTGAHPAHSRDRVLDTLNRVWSSSNPWMGTQSTGTWKLHDGFRARKGASVIDMLLDAESLPKRGAERVVGTHFSRDPSHYSRALASVGKLDLQRITEYAERYLTRERARAIELVPRSGAALPEEASAGTEAPGDDALAPIQVDAARLRAAAPAPRAADVRKSDLANGLTLLVMRRAGLPTASVALLLRGGARGTEEPAAALVAEALARPKERGHGDARDFGARQSVAIGDAVVHRLEGASGNVAIMLAIVAERAGSMEIDSGTWPPFERDAISYLRAAEQRPESVAERDFAAALFGLHPLGKRPKADDLVAAGLDGARAWLDKTYVPANAIVAVVGEFDPLEIETIAAQTLGGWHEEGAPVAPPYPLTGSRDPAPRPGLVVTPRLGSSQAQIRFGCLLPPTRGSAVAVHNDLAARVVSDRLWTRLRSSIGATYGVSARAVSSYGGTAYLEITAAVETGKLADSLGALDATMRTLAADPVDATALAWAKLRTARSKSLRFMTNGDAASELVRRVALGWGLGSLDAFASELAGATADDVTQALRACAAGKPTLSIVGDEAAAHAAFRQTWP